MSRFTRHARLFMLVGLLLASAGHAQLLDTDWESSMPECYLAKQRIGQGLRALGGNPPVPPVDYDIEHYDLDITVDFDTESISGAVGITARSLVASLTQLEVDLLDNMTVSAITRGAVPLAYTHSGDRIVIDLDRGFGLDEVLTIVIVYSGTPAPGGVFVTDPFEFGEHGGSPIAASFSQPWYARHWWPCKEDPSDKATADVSFTVPAGMIAASNGTLAAIIDNGATKTYHWQTAHPIANYLIAGTMTNFVVFSDTHDVEGGGTMPLDFYVYPELLAGAMTAWSVTGDMLTFFRGFFGEYPFVDEKYGMVMWPGSGMENQTLSSIGACCYQSITLVSHELAHQWWGDDITCATWHDVWLNEGFATWAACLWHGEVGPPNSYVECLESVDHPGSWDGSLYRTDLSGVLEIFNSIVYGKGAWVVHMLRGVLGDAAFVNALGAYRSTHSGGAVTTADFQAAVEASSGLDLDWFFEQWVYELGRPDYEYTWQGETPTAGQLTLRIDQVQTDAGLFKMPIPIDVETSSGTERFVVWDSLATQEFVVDVTGTPTGVSFDPENWVLDYHDEITIGVVGVDDRDARFGIEAIAPTPFTDETTFTLRVPAHTTGASRSTTLEILDVSGRRVRALPLFDVRPGRVSIRWNGRSELGHPVEPGVYYARLASMGPSDVRRLVRTE